MDCFRAELTDPYAWDGGQAAVWTCFELVFLGSSVGTGIVALCAPFRKHLLVSSPSQSCGSNPFLYVRRSVSHRHWCLNDTRATKTSRLTCKRPTSNLKRFRNISCQLLTVSSCSVGFQKLSCHGEKRNGPQNHAIPTTEALQQHYKCPVSVVENQSLESSSFRS